MFPSERFGDRRFQREHDACACRKIVTDCTHQQSDTGWLSTRIQNEAAGIRRSAGNGRQTIGIRIGVLLLRRLEMFASAAVTASLLCALWLAFPSRAAASDMTGAWATDAAACDRIFVKRGDRISFRSGSHRHGKGFILEENGIRGRVATCRIKWREGQPLELAAICTGNVFDTAHFTLRVIDGQTFGRVVAGNTKLEIYQRCWP